MGGVKGHNRFGGLHIKTWRLECPISSKPNKLHLSKLDGTQKNKDIKNQKLLQNLEIYKIFEDSPWEIPTIVLKRSAVYLQELKTSM